MKELCKAIAYISKYTFEQNETKKPRTSAGLKSDKETLRVGQSGNNASIY